MRQPKIDISDVGLLLLSEKVLKCSDQLHSISSACNEFVFTKTFDIKKELGTCSSTESFLLMISSDLDDDAP